MVRLVTGGLLGIRAAGVENGITLSLAEDKEQRFYISAALASVIEACKYKMPYQMSADMQRGFYGINGIANFTCGCASHNNSLGWGALVAHTGGAALSYYTHEPELVWHHDENGNPYAEIIVIGYRKRS